MEAGEGYRKPWKERESGTWGQESLDEKEKREKHTPSPEIAEHLFQGKS